MSPAASRPGLRDDLIRVILGDTPEFVGELTDSTSLIQSGVVDSVRLLDVAVFVEQQVGHPIDLTSIELDRAWDTIPDILGFIDTARQSDQASVGHSA